MIQAVECVPQCGQMAAMILLNFLLASLAGATFLHCLTFDWTEGTTSLRLEELTKVLLGPTQTTLYLGDNTTFFILLEVVVFKTTGGLVGSAVQHLGA